MIELDRNSWNYLADCLSGCMNLWDEVGHMTRGMIAAEIHDAHHLDQIGAKWFSNPDHGVAVLLSKIESATQEEVDQIVAAVRRFWEQEEEEVDQIVAAVRRFWEQEEEEVDLEADEWWTPRA